MNTFKRIETEKCNYADGVRENVLIDCRYGYLLKDVMGGEVFYMCVINYLEKIEKVLKEPTMVGTTTGIEDILCIYFDRVKHMEYMAKESCNISCHFVYNL